MKFRVVIEDAAEQEFVEAVDFFDERVPGLGQRFAREVYEAFRKVSDDPERFPLATRLTRKVKIPPPWPYSIYFAINAGRSEVVISTVWHSARNPAELRQRLK
jgi:plasmid stabilization system protein ParE